MNSFKQNKNSVSSVSLCENKQYEAFGNLKWESGTFSDNREFTSKEKDPTGFHYFGARYYSGDIGRFLSPDPILIQDLTDPQSLNPYTYCFNNPLKFIDPTGMIVTWGEGFNSSAMVEDWKKNNPYLYEQYVQLNESEEEYHVMYKEGLNSSGDFTYNFKDKRFEVLINKKGDLSFDAAVSHEFEHGLQFERGQLGFYRTELGTGTLAYDLTDELAAWKAAAIQSQDNLRKGTDFTQIGKFNALKDDKAKIWWLGTNNRYQQIKNEIGPVNVNIQQITQIPGLIEYKAKAYQGD
jgi:RHS repeat-associated protein